ncbi:hypothetical protein RQN30_10425 [Arcanobacterium hippocoleae]
MLNLIQELCARSWRQYLSSILALIVAAIFIFLQMTAPAYLKASLEKSVAKTIAGADALVVESALPRDEVIRRLKDLPEIVSAEANTAVTLQAVSGNVRLPQPHIHKLRIISAH